MYRPTADALSDASDGDVVGDSCAPTEGDLREGDGVAWRGCQCVEVQIARFQLPFDFGHRVGVAVE